MDEEKALHQRWQQLTGSLNADPARVSAEFREIAARYTESHRSYHNLSHLSAVFADLDRFGVTGASVELAVWFHDIIYRPLSSRNESRSALFATRALRRLGADGALVERVAQLIIMTRRHQCPPGDEEAQWFLDADMAILGVPEPKYRDYTERVRREFAQLPGPLYRRGRRRFLSALDASERVFGSDRFFDAYESHARANIAWELRQL